MVPSVTVRPARQADIAAIQWVARTTWCATYAHVLPMPDIEQFLTSAYGDRSLAAKINRLAEGFVVAELAGSVIGYAMTGINRDGVPELFALYVLPDHHGTGAAKRLWEAALEVLAAAGHSRVCCWVLESNRRARRFYERQGALLVELREGQVGATTIREARYCVAICPDGQATRD